MTWRNRGPETESAFKTCIFLAVILCVIILCAFAGRDSAKTAAQRHKEDLRELVAMDKVIGEVERRAKVEAKEVEK